MIRRTLTASALLLATTAATASAGTLTSTPYGAVDFGDQIAYGVDGPGCEGAHSRVVVTVAGQDVAGPDVTGCTGAARVPSFAAVTAAGWKQGDPIAIELRSGGQSIPLRYFRLEADQAKIAAGAPTVGPAGDQDTGDRDKAVTMGTGDSINLGRVNVDGVDGLSLQLCITGLDGDNANNYGFGPAGALGGNERTEPPVFASVRQGSPTGPALIGPIDVSSNPSTGTRLATEGWFGCYRSLHLPITARITDTAPELFVTVDAAPPGVLQLNSVDVNGTAAKIPAPRETDPAGMRTIFDGASWTGWTQTNCDRHADGSVSNLRTGSDTEVGGCKMVYGKPLQNVVLRFDVRRRSFFDNGEILVGGKEIQLRSVGEFGPGGYFEGYAARAQKLNSWPNWSHIQIAQLGARYVVSVNGRTVTDYTRPDGAPAAYSFSLASQPEWSYRFGAANGFGQELSPDVEKPSEWGDFWFRDVRVLECAGAADPACAAIADANLGQAPKK